ncbi:MAG: cation ABC transporter permease [Candidatus Fischerbacteria bacterium RBG_13_37_8]|uniref:Cation ABC transporter permease n=1 Tax=Candidatus Fischerbacteria bacterium RBG_13_37_8 TaxID=1817863 RepID=A0A1F5VX82_9BACT|nr:MAG: cation ABC transporter permease [Candidatus Fischerbacteria bacterium RBG_13_37_8]
MIELFSYKFMQNALLAALIGGASCGVTGVFVVLMRIPFISVAMSHAAFAGAVLGILTGVNPLMLAIVFSLASAFLIGPIADKADIDTNISIGIIFSIVLGIAFLCMGLIKGPKTEALKYIWGNILMVSSNNIILMAIVLILVSLFIILLFKEMKAVLFSRELSAASGIPEKKIYYIMLFLSGLVVSLNLNTIGGLLIFSLIVNPAAAAYQLTYSVKRMFLLSASFGILSTLTGLFCSYLFDVPSGAVIILISSSLFGIALLFSPKRKVKHYATA